MLLLLLHAARRAGGKGGGRNIVQEALAAIDSGGLGVDRCGSGDVRPGMQPHAEGPTWACP